MMCVSFLLQNVKMKSSSEWSEYSVLTTSLEVENRENVMRLNTLLSESVGYLEGF